VSSPGQTKCICKKNVRRMARGADDQAYLVMKSEETVILQDHHTHCTEVASKLRTPHFQCGIDKGLIGGSCGIHCAPYGKENLWVG
jgi:hypothetical protein